MRTVNVRMLFAVQVSLLLLFAPAGALAKEKGETVIGVGHSATIGYGKIAFEKKPKVTVNKKGIVSTDWKGEESGKLVITCSDQAADHSATVDCGADGRFLAVSVIDEHGKLEARDIFEGLRRAADFGSPPVLFFPVLQPGDPSSQTRP